MKNVQAKTWQINNTGAWFISIKVDGKLIPPLEGVSVPEGATDWGICPSDTFDRATRHLRVFEREEDTRNPPSTV